MNPVDYSVMSDGELRQYFLQNRQDPNALEAYLERLNQKPRTLIASPGDPDFGEKIQAVIEQRLKSSESGQSASN
jgi:hypothetical protein